MTLIECNHTADWEFVEFDGTRYERGVNVRQRDGVLAFGLADDPYAQPASIDLRLCKAAGVKFYKKAKPRTVETIAEIPPNDCLVVMHPSGTGLIRLPDDWKPGTKVKVTVTEVAE